VRTVFIVDDQETSLLLARKALEGVYKTFTFVSAEYMLKFAEKVTPDMILLDVEMPKLNGFEVMKMLINHETLKSVPVIFLTAKNDPVSEIRGFEQGAIDFIAKPFSPPVLLKRIETHIEMNKLLKEIKSKNDELTKIYSLKDNILAMISHDMKNYIGNIQQAVEVINMRYDSFEGIRLVNMIEESTEKALSLVKDILSLNKLETETDTLILTTCNICQLIMDGEESLKMTAKQKNINIVYDLPDEPVYCMINPEKFQRALDNLFNNAIKFTKPEGLITIAAKKYDDMIHIYVSDTGIGIEKDMIGKLFDKFSKAGRIGTMGEASTGLGLYIVKQIIHQHKGTIEVLSEVDKGTQFTIKIPITSSP